MRKIFYMTVMAIVLSAKTIQGVVACDIEKTTDQDAHDIFWGLCVLSPEMKSQFEAILPQVMKRDDAGEFSLISIHWDNAHNFSTIPLKLKDYLAAFENAKGRLANLNMCTGAEEHKQYLMATFAKPENMNSDALLYIRDNQILKDLYPELYSSPTYLYPKVYPIPTWAERTGTSIIVGSMAFIVFWMWDCAWNAGMYGWDNAYICRPC